MITTFKIYENTTRKVKGLDYKYISECASYIMQMCKLTAHQDGFSQWTSNSTKSANNGYITYYFVFIDKVYENLINFLDHNNIFNIVRKGEIFSDNTTDVVFVIDTENVIKFSEMYININKYNI